MWKKTGAWFYKSLPTYELSEKVTRSSMHELRKQPERTRKLGIRVNDSSSDDDEEDTNDSKPENTTNGKRSSHFLERMNSLRLHSNATSNSTSNLNEDGYFYRKLSSTLSLFSRQQSNNSNHECGSLSSEIPAHLKLLDEHHRRSSLIRCGSESSTYSISETSSVNDSNNFAGSTSNSNQMCREPPLGWLELLLIYTEAEHTMDCSLFRARDLPAIDITCLPDPYARLNIIMENGTPKQKKWLQTRTVHKTRSPEFNETIRFFGVEPDELATSILYVVILDEDKYGSDFLGTAKIQLATVESLKFLILFELY